MFWPGGKDIESGQCADHIWAWRIPQKREQKKKEEEKEPPKKKQRKENKSKSKRKKQNISKLKTAGKKLPFNACIIEFYFRDKEHALDVKTSSLRREDLDFNCTVREICEIALKRLQKTDALKKKKSPSKIYTLSEENLERFRKFHVIFNFLNDNKKEMIGEWKAKNASSLERTMYSVWDQCISAKNADKARKRDLQICLLLSYSKAPVPYSGVVRRVSAKKKPSSSSSPSSSKKSSSQLRREARKLSRTSSSAQKRKSLSPRNGSSGGVKTNPSLQEYTFDNGMIKKLQERIRQLKSKIKRQKRSFSSTMERLNTQKEEFRIEIERLKIANTLSLKALQKSSSSLSAHFEEKWSSLYSNIEIMREALKIELTKRKFWIQVGPGDKTGIWQMRRTSPSTLLFYIYIYVIISNVRTHTQQM